MAVRKTSSSSATPPTVTSPRKATTQQQNTKHTATVVNANAMGPAIGQRQSSEDDEDDDDGEVFNEDKLRTIRDKAAMK